jgi:hypothetical protein
MLAAEASRQAGVGTALFPPSPASAFRTGTRSWYAMASYKLTEKLSAGLYDTQLVDHQMALGPLRYTKDWAISSRYDFNQFLYAKAEEHIVDGTYLNYDTVLTSDLKTWAMLSRVLALVSADHEHSANFVLHSGRTADSINAFALKI